jgi:hypothetical protein
MSGIESRSNRYLLAVSRGMETGMLVLNSLTFFEAYRRGVQQDYTGVVPALIITLGAAATAIWSAKLAKRLKLEAGN